MNIATTSKTTLSWPTRHATLQQQLQHPQLETLIADLATSPRAALAIRTAYQQRDRCYKGKAKALDEQTLALDLASALWWASQAGSVPLPIRCSPEAYDNLQALSGALLSPKDFPSVTSLQRSAAAYVEIVRGRFDRQLYVLKTVVKGFARREAHRCNPAFEAHLLAEGQKVRESSRPIPNLLAAFQSQNSLHIVMQYFPAGDLDQLLHSAGEAGMGSGIRGSGGLLEESYVKSYATDIVAAVSWCHQQSFAHRDVKPSNFLLDRNGHLKLCDFATAAPFSIFGQNQRKVHYAYSCLAGTPDYIAPDILLAEEDRLNRLSAQNDERWATTSFGGDVSVSQSRMTNVAQPAADSQGFYGPEVDWWSVGVVIYEMIFKDVPFWAETIKEAHYRIRNHEQYLKLSESVPISHALEHLLRAFLCKRDTRLGTSVDGSVDVKAHLFFEGVDWEHYLDAPAPFVPNLDAAPENLSAGGPLPEEEPSVLHSPRPVAGRQGALQADESYSMTVESIRLSQIFNGNPLDFPAFRDHNDEQEQSVAPAALAVADAMSEVAVSSDRRGSWTDVDLNWLGFTALPAAYAFEPAPLARKTSVRRAVATPAMQRMRSFTSLLDLSPACTSADNSPDMWEKLGGDFNSFGGTPISSTPFGRSRASAVPTLPFIAASTPYHAVPQSLQRRAMEKASRLATPGDGRFKTPLRKASMPSVASAFRAGQGETSTIPASPYPFPLASRATPATLGRRAGQLGMSSIIRQGSESPYSRAASGSDSRCSGGSNAKRDLSEDEALKELAQVVAQSARKVRAEAQDRSLYQRLTALEEVADSRETSWSFAGPSQFMSGGQPIGLRKPEEELIDPKDTTPPVQVVALPEQSNVPQSGFPTVVAPVARPAAGLLGRRQQVANPPPQLTSLPSFLHDGSAAWPTPSPDEEPDSPLSSRPGSAMGYLGRPYTSATGASLVPDMGSLSLGSNELRPPQPAGRTLRNRRSDRQLKLQAQERTTPTRTARISSLGPVPEPDQETKNVAPLARSHTSMSSLNTHGDSTPSLTNDSSESEAGSLSSESTRTSFSDVSRVSRDVHRAEPNSSGVLRQCQAPKDRSASGPEASRLNLLEQERKYGSFSRGLRRKDSRETLSEYRRGIVDGTPVTAHRELSPEGSPVDDAFGGRAAVVPKAQVGFLPSQRRTLRRASTNNLTQSYNASAKTQQRPSSSGGSSFSGFPRSDSQSSLPFSPLGDLTNKAVAAAPVLSNGVGVGGVGSSHRLFSKRNPSLMQHHRSSINLRSSFLISNHSIIEENSAEDGGAVARKALPPLPPLPSPLISSCALPAVEGSSPLTKLDQRFGGLQHSVDSLSMRLASLKTRLQD